MMMNVFISLTLYIYSSHNSTTNKCARTGQNINPDYKSLGYNSIYEGMIGEAEKEGRGEEVRERLDKFQQTNQIKAASVLVVAIGSFLAARSAYWSDPDSFLPGI